MKLFKSIHRSLNIKTNKNQIQIQPTRKNGNRRLNINKKQTKENSQKSKSIQPKHIRQPSWRNCKGIWFSYEVLQHLLTSYNPKLVFLQETFLKDPNQLNFKNYQQLSSSSLCRATSTDFPDSLSPSISIVYSSRQVLQAISCISTELL